MALKYLLIAATIFFNACQNTETNTTDASQEDFPDSNDDSLDIDEPALYDEDRFILEDGVRLDQVDSPPLVCTNNTWTTEIVDLTNNVIQDTSIKVDLDGTVHIVYYDDSGSFFNVRHAFLASEAVWDAVYLDMGYDITAGSLSLTVDSLGNLYTSMYRGLIRYAERPHDDLWTVSNFSDSITAGSQPAIGVDVSGTVYLVFYDAISKQVRVALRSGQDPWAFENIITGTNYSQFAIASGMTSGEMLVAGYDISQKDLLFAERSPQGIWTANAIDTTGTVGCNPSIAKDVSGGVHISYYNVDQKSLRYAYRPLGGEWNFSLIEENGNLGIESALVLDNCQRIHVLYVDSINRRLKHAMKTDQSEWTISIVDEGNNVGHAVSLAASNSCDLHASYVDLTTYEMKHARLNCNPL